MIHDKQIQKLEGLGFEVTNQGEDNQGEFLQVKLREAEDQFRELLPKEWKLQGVSPTMDKPTTGRIRPSPIYSETE